MEPQDCLPAQIDRTWQAVDGSALIDALGRGEAPGAPAIEDGYRRFTPTFGAVLAALPIDAARAAIEAHRARIRALNSRDVASASGIWMYRIDDEGVSVVPLLGEAFYQRVLATPAAAAVLERAATLGEVGGWRGFARPVRERWRAALATQIAQAFADVPYPGDREVTSSDWATTEECASSAARTGARSIARRCTGATPT
jgi:hypothetical protein